jgi:hypothetical protein
MFLGDSYFPSLWAHAKQRFEAHERHLNRPSRTRIENYCDFVVAKPIGRGKLTAEFLAVNPRNPWKQAQIWRFGDTQRDATKSAACTEIRDAAIMADRWR